MATYTTEYIFEVVDINGDTAQTRVPSNNVDTLTIATLAGISATLGGDISAVTNGKMIKRSLTILFDEAQFLVGTTPPTNAEYSSVTDGARLNFANNLGERSSLTIPAPVEAVFGANSNVVDSTQVNVATLIADYEAHASRQGGVLFNLYKGGIKVGRRARRRRSSLIP